MTKSTRDTLFGGKVTLIQPASGYRVNVDALLLAAFASGKLAPGGSKLRGPARPAQLAVDLGAGCGAVALALLHWGSAARVTLVEIDRGTASLARDNLEANGWTSRAQVLCENVGDLEASMEADLVVCNPPYVREGRGRPPLHALRAVARQGDLTVFVRAARRIAGRRARACFIYPAHDLAYILDVLRASGLEPKRMRAVHTSMDASARVILVEATAAKSGGLTVEPPVVERTSDGYEGLVRELVTR